jgi:hypothetical protein
MFILCRGVVQDVAFYRAVVCITHPSSRTQGDGRRQVMCKENLDDVIVNFSYYNSFSGNDETKVTMFRLKCKVSQHFEVSFGISCSLHELPNQLFYQGYYLAIFDSLK